MNRPGRWVGRKYTKASMQTDRQTDGKHTSASFTKIGQYSLLGQWTLNHQVYQPDPQTCVLTFPTAMMIWGIGRFLCLALSELPASQVESFSDSKWLSFLPYRLRRVASCVKIYKWPPHTQMEENTDVRLCMSHHYFSSPSRTFCGGRACREASTTCRWGNSNNLPWIFLPKSVCLLCLFLKLSG